MLRLETSDWVLSGLFSAQRETIGGLYISSTPLPHTLSTTHDHSGCTLEAHIELDTAPTLFCRGMLWGHYKISLDP